MKTVKGMKSLSSFERALRSHTRKRCGEKRKFGDRIPNKCVERSCLDSEKESLLWDFPAWKGLCKPHKVSFISSIRACDLF